MSIKPQRLLLLLCCLCLLLLTPATCHAGPIYGKKDRPPLPFERTTKLFTPDPYSSMPEGRSGKTYGIAVIPPITGTSDGGEKAIAELVGHIPAVSMVISLPKSDPLYLFKFLKYMKSTGRRVDFLLIAGHGLQTITQSDTQVFGIKLGSDKSQWLVPVALDLQAMNKELGELSTSESDPAKLKSLCDSLDLIYEGSSALAPGAQLVLHSCYAGHDDQTEMMRTFATAFLGVNGGSAIGPKYAIQSSVLGNVNPQGALSNLSEIIKERALQVGKSLKARRYIKPGDAFIDTQFFTELAIPAGQIKVPACCGKDKEAWRKFIGLWLAPSGNRIRVSSSGGNELKGIIETVAPGSIFSINAGDVSFLKAYPKTSNTIVTNNSYCYGKKKDNIAPFTTGYMELTISSDGKKISGKTTVNRYYDGSTTWDAGTVERSVDWTRIGN
ncbi:MAG: hypothetical protein KC777_11055 [Cyanobacteria bacterium HKST-UBA02]|nr:hypothetical protein [Cyanobacteria bacterium HKST-UBA02]